MKNIKIFAMIALLCSAVSCKDFEELQFDPNRTTQTHPSLLLTNIEVSTFNWIDLGSALASRMMVFTDGPTSEQYYGWQRSGFGRYNTLRQVIKMEEEATRLNLENYNALALFFKSFHIIELTKVFGDVPYSQALKGASSNFAPEYDTQEEIYLQVLNDLQLANSSLDASKGAITGDVIYGGNILQWKKLINSYALRVLISLSAKTGNGNLEVVSRFNEIVSDPDQYPIFESNDDNAALFFHDIAGNRYPYLDNNNLKTAYYMEESFINMLKDHQDPRLFIFADKKPQGTALPDTDFDAYGGVDGSAPLAENTTRVLNGEASRIDARYYDDPENEPSVVLSYAEVEFSLAEAAARGWISDDPAVHYESGIRASMDFHGIDAADQDAYMIEPDVVYVPASGIEQIITQKYINYFLQGGWESFYNHLRTGFPVFSTDGGGVLNDEQVPMRWMYPQDELLNNLANVNEAIARQFPDGDDVNAVMWLYEAE